MAYFIIAIPVPCGDESYLRGNDVGNIDSYRRKSLFRGVFSR